jgi:hypothetical protein
VTGAPEYADRASERGRSSGCCGPVVSLGGIFGQLTLGIALLALHAVDAAAQVPAARPAAIACTPISVNRGAAITFGHEGGTLRPHVVAIGADGVIRAGSDSASDSVATVPAAAVAALARLARTGGFWTLRGSVIRRPTPNPDAARTFIAVALSCGSRRVEYVTGEPVPAAFTELQALLTLIAGPSPGR